VHDLKTAQDELRRARDQAQEASRSKDRFLRRSLMSCARR
jgi:hypothetical protein